MGVFIAIIIVFLLIFGTISVTLTIKNNQTLLICLCSMLGIVSVLLSLFIVWQQKQAKRQRGRSTRPFVLQKQNKVRTNAFYKFYSIDSNSYLPHHIRFVFVVCTKHAIIILLSRMAYILQCQHHRQRGHLGFSGKQIKMIMLIIH